jgi:Lanthionine-containing peptide SapB precursor RamS
MSVMDLQGMDAAEHNGGGGGGSTLTVATCQSQTPSNLSLAICHF